MARRAGKSTADGKWWVAIVVGVVAAALISRTNGGTSSAPFSYSVRVQHEVTGVSIANALVTLEVANKAPLTGVSDSGGYARIFVDSDYAGREGRVRVEANGYGSITREIDLTQDRLPQVIPLAVAANPASAPTPTRSVHAQALVGTWKYAQHQNCATDPLLIPPGIQKVETIVLEFRSDGTFSSATVLVDSSTNSKLPTFPPMTQASSGSYVVPDARTLKTRLQGATEDTTLAYSLADNRLTTVIDASGCALTYQKV
jgi:hypothetical protein